jgi:hypothetical protein
MSLSDELAQVRAEIKTWERSFRAENGRDPSRDDIKAVPEISQYHSPPRSFHYADQNHTNFVALKYKLYKSLSKSKDLSSSQPASSQPSQSQSQSQSQSRPPSRPSTRPLDKTPTSSTRSFFQSVSSISTAASISTPLADDQSNPFLETTPVVRRGSSITTTRGKPSTPVQDDTSNPFLSPTAGGKNGSVSTSVSGSRSGTNGVATGSVSSARRSSRPYGPSVSDPSFPDPFASPSKSQARIQASGSRSLTSVLRTPGKSTSQQEGQAGSAADGFLFAPSPSRLKSLLEANSLSRSPSKMSPPSGISGNSVGMTGITPRTKARKRLRGEEVEDTPKPRGRGSRGSSGAKGFFGSDGLGRGRSDDEDDDRAEDEDEDEVLGPTPKKGELRTTTSNTTLSWY